MARFGRGFPTPFRYRISRVGPTPTFTRSFNSTSDNITCAIGSLADFRDGNMTVGAIIKLTDTTDASIVEFRITGDPTPLRCSLAHGSTIPFGLQDNLGGQFVGPPPSIVANVWCIAVITRTAGVLRAHFYNYNTGVWSHTAGPTVNGVNETLNAVRLGGGVGAGDFGCYGGLMAVAGAQAGTAFSDVQVETLNVGLQEWVDLFTAGAVWRLDQDSTATAVPDIVGAADQTAISGTSVVADSPAGFDWSLGGGETPIALADTGSSSQTIEVAAAIPLADAAAATDAINIAAAVPLAEVASAADSLAVTIPITLADAGAAADALAVTAAVPLTEAGTATQALVVSATVPLADTGTAADAIVVDSSEQKPVADAGAGSDAVTVAASVPLAEAGTATDALAVAQTRALADTGSATDALAVDQTKALADTGAASEALSVAAAVPLADLAAAAENVTAAVLVALAETAAGSDTLDVFIPPPVPPPRWVEGASAASGLVEHAGAATGRVEGVLVGAGVVEGGASV